MSRNIDLPEEVAELLGDNPEREALEALLLHLIRADRVSVAWAGEKLGLDSVEAVRWYTSHGYPFPDYTEKEIEEDFRHAEELIARRREEAPRGEERGLDRAHDSHLFGDGNRG